MTGDELLQALRSWPYDRTTFEAQQIMLEAAEVIEDLLVTRQAIDALPDCVAATMLDPAANA